MPVTSIASDPDTLQLKVIADFPVPVAQLWAAWSNPRTLERFWGPPTWPATFTAFDLRPKGLAKYTMTGPDGQKAGGWWEFQEVEPGVRFSLVDGFSNEHGEPVTDLPTTHMEMRFEATDSGSRFVSVSTFPSLEAMQQMIEMGMVEGLRQAMGQIDQVLASM